MAIDSAGTIYVGGADIRALNGSTGALLWTHPVGFGAAALAPALGGGGAGRVFFPDGFGYVTCLSADNGTLLWTYNAHGAVAVAVAGGSVYASSTDAYVYALAPPAGRSFGATTAPHREGLPPPLVLGWGASSSSTQ